MYSIVHTQTCEENTGCTATALELCKSNFQAAAFASNKQEIRQRALSSGRDVAILYRELLQMVMTNLTKSSGETKSSLSVISRNIAQSVTDLAEAAEMLKDDDWVDPADPTFIAENELLGAAKSIENAAKKLASLKPRRDIKGKVCRLKHIILVAIFSLCYSLHTSNFFCCFVHHPSASSSRAIYNMHRTYSLRAVTLPATFTNVHIHILMFYGYNTGNAKHL